MVQCCVASATALELRPGALDPDLTPDLNLVTSLNAGLPNPHTDTDLAYDLKEEAKKRRQLQDLNLRGKSQLMTSLDDSSQSP
ncbi:hypothetical protein PtA15_6A728 [Puccinia triticina]|uniref:Uncharacterized protein n=1 Tax=Puccinia triticina TaxID=208348 RepID=A0ABY7CP21_9BASI|nr:uncharacterized protein PtA15_6A728 [Puccinia triticina]WAQ86098.1 hypothetical protein PtA15_6A728 [Puccinia triticina]